MNNSLNIAIQGIRGSFHHNVVQNYFDRDFIIHECLTFDALVERLISQKSDISVMAIENSIAGSIIPNYARIDANNLCIVGEHYLDVQHNLMALKNQNIEDIKEVHSHPMALLQCKTFFNKFPDIKLVEAKDTADVARDIASNNIKGIAAIASKVAAELYDLDVLAKNIQTIKDNETRFVVIKKHSEKIVETDINKVSLKLELEHKRGSLAAILNVLSDCKLNLTKIQSLPKIETPWKYAFFIDVTFDDYKNFEKAKAVVKIMAENFKILGEYKNAKS